MTKDELIAALEKATGPDRELDGLIAEHIGVPHGPKEFVHIEHRSIEVHAEIAPHYTGFIDAAMTLTPQGMAWNLCGYDADGGTGVADGTDYRLPYAVIADRPRLIRISLAGEPEEWDRATYEARGTTPAIALCIAALRARP